MQKMSLIVNYKIKNEIKYVSQEIINANARTSTKFNELVGSSLSKYIEVEKIQHR